MHLERGITPSWYPWKPQYAAPKRRPFFYFCILQYWQLFEAPYIPEWIQLVCLRYANRGQEVVRTDGTLISIKIWNYWATEKLNNKMTTNHLMAASPGLAKPKNFLNGGFTTLKIHKVRKWKWTNHFRQKFFVLISHIYLIFLFVFISIPVWTLKLHKPFLTARQPAGRGNYRLVGSYWKIPKLWNQVPSLDHFVVQNSGDFLCWKYR